MSLVLDTGALIAFDRGDRHVAALIEATRRRRDIVETSSGCVAQAWRDGTRQALLARLLRGVRERGLDQSVARSVGALCGRTATTDVVDAHVATIAGDGDLVLTSDPVDISSLLGVTGAAAVVRRC